MRWRARSAPRAKERTLGSKTNRLTFEVYRCGPKITPGYWDRYVTRAGEDGLTITFCLLMFLYVV
jgi:hypothetical protein